MLISITVMSFINDYYYGTLENAVDARTLRVDKDDNYEIEIPEISKIEHVTYVAEWKFNGIATNRETDLFRQNGLETNIIFVPLLEKGEIKIVDGRNIENDGEAVCPVKFYPYSTVVKKDNEMLEKIYPSKIIKGKDVIGKSITVVSDSENYSDIDVKIVGTYDSYANMREMDTCYISKNDFEKVLAPYSGFGIRHNDDGTTEKEYFPHSGILVRVDNYKNNKEVINKLNEMGYSAIETFQFESENLKLMYYIPMFIMIITGILALGILCNYIKKSLLYRLKEYAIYLSIGYTKEDVKKINLFESIVLILISLFISSIIYFIGYYVVVYRFFSMVLYYSTKVNVPFFNILLSVILVILILIIFTNHLFKKRINNSIYNILGDNDDYL